eukprot:8574561-Pyramimonas_sp.AAC.1
MPDRSPAAAVDCGEPGRVARKTFCPRDRPCRPCPWLRRRTGPWRSSGVPQCSPAAERTAGGSGLAGAAPGRRPHQRA